MTKLLLLISIAVLLTSCTTLVYTPEESSQRINVLEAQVRDLESDLSQAEEDLESCIELVSECQPLVE